MLNKLKPFAAILLFCSLSAFSMVISDLQGVSELFRTNGFLLQRLHQAKDDIQSYDQDPHRAWEKVLAILELEGCDTLAAKLALYDDSYKSTMGELLALLENSDYRTQSRYVFELRAYLQGHPEVWSELDYSDYHRHLPIMLCGEESSDHQIIGSFLSYIIEKDLGSRPKAEREPLLKAYYENRPSYHYPTCLSQLQNDYAADTIIMPTILINGVNQLLLEKRLQHQKDYPRDLQRFALVSQWIIYESEIFTPSSLREEVRKYRDLIEKDEYFELKGQRAVLKALGQIFSQDISKLLELDSFSFLTEEPLLFIIGNSHKPFDTKNYKLLLHIDNLVDQHMRKHNDQKIRKFMLTKTYPNTRQFVSYPFLAIEYINRFISRAHELNAKTNI